MCRRVVESDRDGDAIGFTAYLTSPEATDTLIDYSVNGNAGPGFLNASDFPAISCPSGTVTIAAGQTSALFTVAIPAACSAAEPDANLQVVIAPVNRQQSVFAPEAQTEILNTGPTPGNPRNAAGRAVVGRRRAERQRHGLRVESRFGRAILRPAGGRLTAWRTTASSRRTCCPASFEVYGSSQFLNSGLSPFTPIATGDADTAPEVELLTNPVGTFTENVTLTPTDSNTYQL